MKRLVWGIGVVAFGVLCFVSAGNNPQGPAGSLVFGLMCVVGGGLMAHFGFQERRNGRVATESTLTMLRARGRIDASELAARVHVSEIALRRHLASAQRAGIVTLRIALAFVCSLALWPASASAQDVPKGELAVGYSAYRDLTYETSAPVGWVVSPALNLNRWFSVVGDIGGNYGGDNGGAEHAFSGGARFRYSWTKVAVYFQLLGGVATFGGERNGIVQSGLGVDIIVSPAWAVRAESAGRAGQLGGDADTRWRGAIGVVYRIGKK